MNVFVFESSIYLHNTIQKLFFFYCITVLPREFSISFLRNEKKKEANRRYSQQRRKCGER